MSGLNTPASDNKINMNNRNKILLGIVAITSTAVLLTGCAGAGEAPTETLISMSETPNLDRLTIEIDESKLPEGFSTSFVGEIPSDKLAPKDSDIYYTTFNETTQCNIIYIVNFSNSDLAGWGDQYATIGTLKNQIATGILSNKETSTISIGNSNALEGIKVDTSLTIPRSSPAPTGNTDQTQEAKPTEEQTSHQILWARAFDVLQDNGMTPLPIPSGLGAPSDIPAPSIDVSKGVPYLGIAYVCTGDVKPDPEVFNQAVKAITLQGITKP